MCFPHKFSKSWTERGEEIKDIYTEKPHRSSYIGKYKGGKDEGSFPISVRETFIFTWRGRERERGERGEREREREREEREGEREG